MSRQIDKIFAETDWHGIQRTLISLNWIWFGGRSLTIDELKMTAMNVLLSAASSEGGTFRSSGFVATNDNGVLRLRFELPNWG